MHNWGNVHRDNLTSSVPEDITMLHDKIFRYIHMIVLEE